MRFTDLIYLHPDSKKPVSGYDDYGRPVTAQPDSEPIAVYAKISRLSQSTKLQLYYDDIGADVLIALIPVGVYVKTSTASYGGLKYKVKVRETKRHYYVCTLEGIA